MKSQHSPRLPHMDSARPGVRLRLGIFLISAATLCYEVSLTRYFSITQSYHFAFLVVGIAFLGYGASGTALALSRWIRALRTESLLASLALLFSLSIVASILLAGLVPFDFQALAWRTQNVALVGLYYVILSIPFFFAGLAVSTAVSRMAAAVHKIYFADLFGAGAGSLAALLVFYPAGERGAFPAISLMGLAASVAFGSARRRLLAGLQALTFVLVTALMWHSSSLTLFPVSAFKGLSLALRPAGSNTLIRRWNSVSRVDVISSPLVRFSPGLSLTYEAELPPQLGISLDAGEISAVTGVRSLEDQALEFLRYLPSSFAFELIQNPDTLIIEPRGGLDVLAAQYFRASSVTAIESNPLIARILQKDLEVFSGGIYGRAGTRLILSQPRAALSREAADFDLVVLSETDVLGASSTGLHGFGENYLLTVEGAQAVLQRLKPRGLVSVTAYLLPPPRREIKLLATWIEALERQGHSPSSRLLVIRSWGTFSFFVRNEPFSGAEVQSLRRFAQDRLFDLVYFPDIQNKDKNIFNEFPRPIYEEMTQALLDPPTRSKLYRDSLFQIRPAIDDNPFFYNSLRLGKSVETYKAFGKSWLPLLQGEFMVLVFVLQAAVVSFILILFPLLVFRRSRSLKTRALAGAALYFGGLGAGFMLVEVTLIQKFILFLGHPLYSASVVLASLLVSAGAGSLFSKNFLGSDRGQWKRRAAAACLLCSVVILLERAGLARLIPAALSSAPPLKVLLTLGLVSPMGFLMGIPFPSGVRILEASEQRLIPWAWAVNAFSGVVSAAAALLLAFVLGYGAVLMAAAGCYSVALLSLYLSHHGDKAHA